MEKIIVTETPSELRRLARAVMKGNWKLLTAGMVIYGILASLVPNVLSVTVESLSYSVYLEEYDMNYSFPTFLYMYRLLLSGLLEFGVIAFTLHFLRTRQVRYDRLFAGFERFAAVFLVSFLITVIVGLWSLLFVIPGIIAMLRYSMSLYILHDEPKIGVVGALRASKWMTTGNKTLIFLTMLSFIGWRILANIPAVMLDSLYVAGAVPNVSQSVLVILEFLLFIPSYIVMAYTEVTMGLLYEIMSGKLRKTPPQETAFIPQGGGSVL